jgi:hypothetical protein
MGGVEALIEAPDPEFTNRARLEALCRFLDPSNLGASVSSSEEGSDSPLALGRKRMFDDHFRPWGSRPEKRNESVKERAGVGMWFGKSVKGKV